MIRMPGKSYDGPLPPLTETEAALRDALRQDVETLAGEIGERNVFCYSKLVAAAEFIERAFADARCTVRREGFEAADQMCYNLEATITGVDQPDEIVVVGAHYDSVLGCPGANDNGTGVAAMLALARAFSGKKTSKTLRFVAFVNEEPPFFQTNQMGSMVYAQGCRDRNENVVGMLSLETIGYFRDEAGSQHYPSPMGLFYPTTGNFIAFVGNRDSKKLVREVVASFRRQVKFPSEGGALPNAVPGIDWSDHWGFWQMGYPALMVTDTAPFRYPYYHTPQDTPDKVDYEPFARLTAGLALVVKDLVGVERET